MFHGLILHIQSRWEETSIDSFGWLQNLSKSDSLQVGHMRFPNINNNNNNNNNFLFGAALSDLMVHQPSTVSQKTTQRPLTFTPVALSPRFLQKQTWVAKALRF